MICGISDVLCNDSVGQVSLLSDTCLSYFWHVDLAEGNGCSTRSGLDVPNNIDMCLKDKNGFAMQREMKQIKIIDKSFDHRIFEWIKCLSHFLNSIKLRVFLGSSKLTLKYKSRHKNVKQKKSWFWFLTFNGKLAYHVNEWINLQDEPAKCWKS